VSTKLSDYDYELPGELIAQRPVQPRHKARLMVVDRSSGSIRHSRFEELEDWLTSSDCLVLNDTRVIPARLEGVKEPGGRAMEVFLVRRINKSSWQVMVKPGKKLKVGEEVRFSVGGLRAKLLAMNPDGMRVMSFEADVPVEQALEQAGSVPLPPYIKRPADEADREAYQTVFARVPGAVAAPTAGMHFSPEILDRLRGKGLRTAFVTLHTGPGTFLPVRVEDVTQHAIHAEYYEVRAGELEKLRQAREGGSRMVAVGTTVVRVLETLAGSGDPFSSRGSSGWTSLFVYPPFEFKLVDALLTNFHLPRSTLLMLVSAFAGRELILEAYHAAIERKYRFYSYGDAMLIT